MIYIVRHGQTTKNRSNLLQGRSDMPLNEEGRKQAADAGRRLAELGITEARVYSSPLIRAVETAEIMTDSIAACHIYTDERLIEMDYGPYEGMDLMNPAPEVMAFFMDFAGTPAPDGMEQLDEVVRRTGEFIEEIREAAKAGDVIISTHAIAMKGILEYLTPDSHGSYWSTNISNCDIYAADASEGVIGVPYKI